MLLVLRAAFTQAGTHLLAEPCTLFSDVRDKRKPIRRPRFPVHSAAALSDGERREAVVRRVQNDVVLGRVVGDHSHLAALGSWDVMLQITMTFIHVWI